MSLECISDSDLPEPETFQGFLPIPAWLACAAGFMGCGFPLHFVAETLEAAKTETSRSAVLLAAGPLARHG